MADATCKTCPYYSGDRESECRRGPPVVATNARSGEPGQPADPHWHMHPNTRPDVWCGEHPLRQRDRLAAMAMQGLLAFPGSVCGKHDRDSADVARVSYEIAEAMLAEREKRTPAQEPTP